MGKQDMSWLEAEKKRLLGGAPESQVEQTKGALGTLVPEGASGAPQAEVTLDLSVPQVPETVDFNEKPRTLDMKRLLRESQASKRVDLTMATNDLQLRWVELYYRSYEQIYPVSGRERGMLRNLAKKNLEGTIVAAMVAMFWDFLKDDWHKERHMTPSLLVFLNHWDAWKAQGLAIK